METSNAVGSAPWSSQVTEDMLADKMNPADPSNAPRVVPVLVTHCPLNKSGTKWVRVGLNAATQFTPMIQITNEKGKGVYLEWAEFKSMMNADMREWILNSFKKPKNAESRALGDRSFHRLVIKTQPNYKTMIVLERRPEDFPDCAYTAPPPAPLEEIAVYMTQPTWEHLHDVAVFIDTLCEELSTLSNMCAQSLNTVRSQIVMTLLQDKSIDHVRIQDTEYLRKYVRDMWYSLPQSYYVENSDSQVTKMLHELRAHHSLFVAFMVREAFPAMK